jgi:organic radical activating enzyme
LDNLPVVNHYQFDEILITGGEPMLFPDKVVEICDRVRCNALTFHKKAKIFVYTANVNNWVAVQKVLEVVDGITVTLHEQLDVEDLVVLDSVLSKYSEKSLRLNIFKGITIPKLKHKWKIKDNMIWMKNCPLPENETFKRISSLWE